MSHPKPPAEKPDDREADVGQDADETTAQDIETNPGLSPVAEQPGAASMANVGKRRGSELFREDG